MLSPIFGRDPLDPGTDSGDVNDAKILQEYQWDFSITISINATLILLYCVQIVRLYYSGTEKRNKLTFAIYWSLNCNLIAVFMKAIASLCLTAQWEHKNQITMYGLESVACIFFVVAICLQAFEWDMVQHMIHFQGTNQLNTLEIKKD